MTTASTQLSSDHRPNSQHGMPTTSKSKRSRTTTGTSDAPDISLSPGDIHYESTQVNLIDDVRSCQTTNNHQQLRDSDTSKQEQTGLAFIRIRHSTYPKQEQTTNMSCITSIIRLRPTFFLTMCCKSKQDIMFGKELDWSHKTKRRKQQQQYQH